MTSVFNPKRGASYLAKLIKRLQVDEGRATDQPIEPATALQAAFSFDPIQLDDLLYNEYNAVFRPEDWCVGSRVQGKFAVGENTQQFKGDIIRKFSDQTGHMEIKVHDEEGDEQTYTLSELQSEGQDLTFIHGSNSSYIQPVNEILRLLLLMPVVNGHDSNLGGKYRLELSTMGVQMLLSLDNEVSEFLKKIVGH
jgi:hypothetical protein